MKGDAFSGVVAAMKKTLSITSLIVAGLLTLSACSASTAETPAAESAQPQQSQTAATEESTQPTDAAATQQPVAEAVAGVITLSGSTAVTGDPGVTVADGLVTVMSPGTYTLTGDFSGQVVVNSQNDGAVELVLSNASITNADEAAIYVEQADDTVITIAKDTENALSATGVGVIETDSDGNTDVVGAALYSSDDLTIQGEGSLTVSCDFNNGIHCKDDLEITGGVVSVTAENNGIKGKDSVTISGGVVNVQAGGDGIQSDNTEDIDKGNVEISGGVVNVVCDHDGVQAEKNLLVSGGTINITSGGGNVNAEVKTEAFFGGRPGMTSENTSDEETVSIKGLKAGANLTVSGGAIAIDACDDALHSNGLVLVTGGTLNLASGDDGIHANDNTTIEGGTISISTSYEGIEGQIVLVSGGTIDVVSSDDGFNAAGGNDMGMGGWFGTDTFSSTKGASELRFTGGLTTVNAGGDGIDSNGLLTIEGGEVYVDGPTNSGNGAIDSGAGATVSGGTVIAVGASGMAENFDSDSTQCAMRYNFDSTIEAGTTITVADSSGKVVLEHTCKKTCNSIVVSSPELVQGETYTFTAEGQSGTLELTAVTASNTSGGGMGGPRHQS